MSLMASTVRKYSDQNVTVMEGVYPISSTAATIKVGQLLSTDVVLVCPLEAKASYAGFAYDRAGSTFSMHGGIVSVKHNGGASPASTCLTQVVVFKNRG